MTLIVKHTNADTIPLLLENIKDMAMQMPSGQDLGNLKAKVESLDARIKAIEDKLKTGITNSTHYLCNNDGTYNAGNSKIITITEGIITAIEA